MYVSNNFKNCVLECFEKQNLYWYKRIIANMRSPSEFRLLTVFEQALIIIVHTSSSSTWTQVENKTDDVRYDLQAVKFSKLLKIMILWSGKNLTMAQLRKALQVLVDQGLVKDHLANPSRSLIKDLKYFPSIKALNLIKSINDEQYANNVRKGYENHL